MGRLTLVDRPRPMRGGPSTLRKVFRRDFWQELGSQSYSSAPADLLVRSRRRQTDRLAERRDDIRIEPVQVSRPEFVVKRDDCR